MSCLCSKLRAGSYDLITQSEAQVLTDVFIRAPQLFPSDRKRKRSKTPKESLETLKASYPSEEIREVLENHQQQWLSQPRSFLAHKDTQHVDVVVRLYVALERIGQSSTVNGLARRIVCVALTELHRKWTNIDDLVSRVHNSNASTEKQSDVIKKKFYAIFKAGNKWKQLIQICSEKGVPKDSTDVLTNDSTDGSAGRSGHLFTGILWLLGKSYDWERANESLCEQAIADIGARTDLYAQSKEFSPLVNSVLKHLKTVVGFNCHNQLDPLATPSQPSGGEVDIGPFSRPQQGTLTHANRSTKRTRPSNNPPAVNKRAYSISTRKSHETEMTPRIPISDWKTQSEVAVLQAVPSLRARDSRCRLLAMLLCFFQHSPISLELLWRGASSQRRWSELGEMEEVGAAEVGLEHDLVTILSDYSGLVQLLNELEAITIIKKNSSSGTPSFTLDPRVLTRVREGLSSVLQSFWRSQALLIASHSFPRKYLEPDERHRQLAKRLLPALQHTLMEFSPHEIPERSQADLILSLVEASRFSSMEWKHLAVSHARNLLQNSKEFYLHACAAHRHCTVSRLSGDTEQSALALKEFRSQIVNLERATNPRAHAELGQLTLQSAIIHIQNEELAKAQEEFRAWQPLHPASPSTAERIILYHIDLWRGKAHRYQGAFVDSFECLQRAMLGIDHDHIEDLRPDVICNLGDLYCELNNPTRAEDLLNAELSRMECQGKKNTSDWYLLQLSRAESIWGQGRLDEAEALSSDIRSFPHLSKISKLRLSTLFGRIYQVKCDWIKARQNWTDALSQIQQYLLVNGHTSRTIMYCIKEVLSQQGDFEWSSKYEDQIRKMETIKPGGCKYWIPGLGRWHHHLAKTARL